MSQGVRVVVSAEGKVCTLEIEFTAEDQAYKAARKIAEQMRGNGIICIVLDETKEIVYGAHSQGTL